MTSDHPTVTIKLSRQTVQAMLEMKHLLQRYGMTISIAAPDAYAQLLQASMGINDRDVGRVRDDLIASASVHDSSERWADPPASRPPPEQVSEKSVMPLVSPLPTAPEIDDRTPSPPAPDPLQLPGAPPVLVRAEPPLQRQQGGVPPLKSIGPLARPDRTQPRLHIVATHAPVLTCQSCQHAVTVPIAQGDRSTPLAVRCPCGTQYRVATDARQYPRKPVALTGTYRGLEDEAQSGSMVVDNISLGGIRFRVPASPTLVRDACLHIQFTLDDGRQTCVWEQVQVRHVQGNTLGAVFLAMDVFNPGLTDFMQA